MKLEDQICSFELAKKLKELGVKQESLFIWISIIKTGFNFIKIREVIEPDSKEIGAYSYAAFTVSELFNILPSRIMTKENEPFNHFRLRIQKSLICKNDNINELIEVYVINYYCDTMECIGENAFIETKLFPHNLYNENPANLIAETVIYLLDNGLMTI